MENNFGERLRDARIKKGLKQKEVADVLDCAATSLTNWEKGTIQPPLEKLAGLCEVLEISALDLLDRRYTYNDILAIAQKPYRERSYEEQVALNFSGPILAKATDKEARRLDKERENKDYISKATGLTSAAVDALTDYADAFFDGEEQGKLSPVGLEALNKLLSCPSGIQALENIAVYLRAGEFRFADGAKAVTVDVGEFRGDVKITKSFSFTPDMVSSIARSEFLHAIENMRSHIPQEEIDAAREQFRDDMKKP